MKPSVLGAIYLALAASIWGSVYVVSKYVMETVEPLVLIWLRYLIAVVFLGGAVLIKRLPLAVAKRDMKWIAAVGIIGYFLSIWTQFVGTQLSTAQMGAVITSAVPAFMVIFAFFILQERITMRKAAAVILSTCGVLLVIGFDTQTTTIQLGGMILFFAALTWALMSVFVKKIPTHYSQAVLTMYELILASIIMTPLVWHDITLDYAAGLLLSPLGGWIWYLGIVATAAAFYFWNEGLRLSAVGSGSIYFFFQPLVGAFLGWLFLGETIGIGFFCGMILIFVGVYIVMRDEAQTGK
ncbi:MAG: DMT family transporter [Selenomonadales bacterium]|nr:DMT family transporter [Selenomonadales bacterium]